MSQGTPINKLGNTMNDEDSRLVDSILNDLNNDQGGGPPQGGHPQHGGPPQQLTPEQHKMMLEQRQQQMMHQQMMMQQQQQAMMQRNNNTVNTENLSIIDKIQEGWKSILIVFVLFVVLNTSFVDDVFKTNNLNIFIDENGSLNIQATIIKALIASSLYFFIDMFVPV